MWTNQLPGEERVQRRRTLESDQGVRLAINGNDEDRFRERPGLVRKRRSNRLGGFPISLAAPNDGSERCGNADRGHGCLRRQQREQSDEKISGCGACHWSECRTDSAGWLCSRSEAVPKKRGRTGWSALDSALAFWDSAIGVADGGSDRERAFLRLRGSREVGGEAGETFDAEAAAPDFGAELMNKLLC